MVNTVNIDHAEVAKFDEAAARWWDREGEFKPLHDINPLRLRFIQDRVSLHGKRVVDIGCGGGILTESLRLQGADVVGIDAGEGPLKVAKLHLFESGLDIDYRHCTAEELAASEPNSFDVVTCMEMLEHVPDPASVISACATLVKPGGRLFFSTINRNPKAYLLAVIGAEYLLNMLPKGTHDYSKFIKPSELDRWLRAAGLDLGELKGITYHPLTRHFKVTNDIDVNYLAYAQKPLA